MRNSLIKKLIAVVLFVTIFVPGTFATGFPVFDIEGFIYSVMEYSQMLQDAKNTVQGIINAGEQFKTAYEQISSGDLSALSRNRYKMKSSLQKVTKSFDKMLDHAATIQDAVEGTDDYTVYWEEPEMLKDYIDIFKQASADVAESIDDFTQEIAESSEENLNSFDDDSDRIVSSAQSQSVSQQGASVIENIAGLKDSIELQSHMSMMQETQNRLKEEADRKASEAETVYVILQKNNLENEWYENNRSNYFDNIDFSNFDV